MKAEGPGDVKAEGGGGEAGELVGNSAAEIKLLIERSTKSVARVCACALYLPVFVCELGTLLRNSATLTVRCHHRQIYAAA